MRMINDGAADTNGHFSADEFESLVDIVLGFRLILFDQDRPHKLVHDIVRRQGSELLVGWMVKSRR